MGGRKQRPPHRLYNSEAGRKSETIEVPRDRNATFEPQIIPKGQSRFEGFDDKILSLYARGMTTR